jgi:hypothetical protein
MYDGIKICVKCGESEVTDFIEQKRGVRQGCSLSPYLFNIFIDDIIDYIDKGNLHAPVIGMTTIPGLLFADELAFASFIINGLQKAVDQVTSYCKEWSLKCNLNKTKIVVFKKGGKLKRGESWYASDHKIEVVDEINYLRVTFHSSGGWNKQKLKVRAKGNQTLVAIDKCLARAPDMRVTTLENVYEMLSESRTMYGIEMWGLEGGWKEIDKIHARFCKKNTRNAEICSE